MIRNSYHPTQGVQLQRLQLSIAYNCSEKLTGVTAQCSFFTLTFFADGLSREDLRLSEGEGLGEPCVFMGVDPFILEVEPLLKSTQWHPSEAGPRLSTRGPY